jgi:hypothetical protein
MVIKTAIARRTVIAYEIRSPDSAGSKKTNELRSVRKRTGNIMFTRKNTGRRFIVINTLNIDPQRIFFKSDKKYPVPDYLKKLVNMCRNQKRIIHVQPSQQAQDDAFEMKIKQEVAIGTTEVTHNHDVTWKEVAKVIVVLLDI